VSINTLQKRTLQLSMISKQSKATLKQKSSQHRNSAQTQKSTQSKSSVTHITIPYPHQYQSKQQLQVQTKEIVLEPSFSFSMSPAKKNKTLQIQQERRIANQTTNSAKTSSSQTSKMANTLLTNYGNCTTFQLCNENEQFIKSKRYQSVL